MDINCIFLTLVNYSMYICLSPHISPGKRWQEMDGWMAAHCDIIAPVDLAPPAVKIGGEITFKRVKHLFWCLYKRCMYVSLSPLVFP